MKSLFYISVLLLVAFEFFNVYFIMPMPGSQRINSLSIAYFLHEYRWFFRLGILVFLIWGFLPAWKGNRFWVLFSMVILGVVGVLFNGPLTAASMFRVLHVKKFASLSENKIAAENLVIVATSGGEARAYPIQIIGYHHRVLDSIHGEPIFVTYCTVCRTGRVYNPVVDGELLQFKLVGMDHFNAMFEDTKTGSWWRQATGEACAGDMKGKHLDEVFSEQMTVGEFFQRYPNGQVLQMDPFFQEEYDALKKYDSGKSKSKLTGSNPQSWKDKSWVLGIQSAHAAHAYDWNQLKLKHFIADTIDSQGLVVLLSNDLKSFHAWWVPLTKTELNALSYHNGELKSDKFRISSDGTLQLLPEGDSITNAKRIVLRAAPVYQEFWHSWKTFHPETKQRN